MATLKQRKAVELLGVNGGIISRAMKGAGYSENVSKRTDKLTRTNGWKELMEKYLDDKKLAKKHDQLLNAKNENVQLGAVKLGYELKGKIQQNLQSAAPQVVNINFFSHPEVKQATKNLDDTLKKYLVDETQEPAKTL